MTPEEKRLNAYYLRKFGWSLEEVNALDAKQNHACAICHRPPGKIRLSLDHDHAFDRIKCRVWKQDTYWLAEPKTEEEKEFLQKRISPQYFGLCGPLFSRKQARQFFRRVMRFYSVRGLLCLRCNKGLQMFEDSKAPLSPAERFDNAAQYLRNFATKIAIKTQGEVKP